MLSGKYGTPSFDATLALESIDIRVNPVQHFNLCGCESLLSALWTVLRIDVRSNAIDILICSDLLP